MTATQQQNLEDLAFSLPVTNMSIAEAASELKQSLERDFNPIIRAFSSRRNYRRAIVMLKHQSPNFRDKTTIADYLLDNNIVNSPLVAWELAEGLQVELMTFDFAELECSREQTTTKEVKEFEQWTLQQAIANHCPYK